MRRPGWGIAAAAALGVIVGSARLAEACGCFAPPDPSVPVVQAGERILFARAGGVVTAHIQIQYAGAAAEFGWLLPLPSRPEMELGTDELFTQLIAATQPRYTLQRIFEGACNVFSGPLLDARVLLDAGSSGGAPGPALEEGSIGPYDYAVLRADSRDELLDWLADNRYFVPAGTDDAVAPYIHQGAFFLALKLRSGKSVGDLQPVVVKYASDLPMIPIVLTSVAAQPDMGIQVWMLGEGRAIPRNYAHTVLNDARIDWLNGGANYNDLVIAATREAPGRHTFVTEYAGGSEPMRGRLAPPGRFGSVESLGALTDPQAFLAAVRDRGYAPFTGSFGQRVYSAPLLAILGAALPMPAALAARGIPAVDFYSRPEFWLGVYRAQNPAELAGWPAPWDPLATAQELDARVAEPARRAEALFTQHPYLTRLYTTLSPEHMTRDPVFSENRSLPNVSNQRSGTLTFHCGDQPLSPSTPATLRTADGFVIRYPDGIGVDPRPPLPYSSRIEAVREEGAPEAMTDNRSAIASALSTIDAIPGVGGGPQSVDPYGHGGCAAGGEVGSIGVLLVLAVTLLLRAWRCGPSSRA